MGALRPSRLLLCPGVSVLKLHCLLCCLETCRALRIATRRARWAWSGLQPWAAETVDAATRPASVLPCCGMGDDSSRSRSSTPDTERLAMYPLSPNQCSVRAGLDAMLQFHMQLPAPKTQGRSGGNIRRQAPASRIRINALSVNAFKVSLLHPTAAVDEKP